MIPIKYLDIINEVDGLKPNGFEQSRKLGWLAELDGKVELYIKNFEGPEIGLDETPDADSEIIADPHYSSMYRHWLEAMIDYNNGEIGKYNNSMTMFNADFSEWKARYSKTHMHKAVYMSYY